MDPFANPFATNFVAPGQLSWLGFSDRWLDDLAELFNSLNRRAQIIGPHGSGKSTLLKHFVPRAAEQCVPSGSIYSVALRRDPPVLKDFFRQLGMVQRQDLLIVDGFEQLGLIGRWWVRAVTQRKGCGLLVTGHRPLGLRTLHRTEVTADLANQIVRTTWRDVTGFASVPTEISQIDMQKLLAGHRGNMRECLMELYDLLENERRKVRRNSGTIQARSR